ncbi:MAG: NAD(P)H-dependent oxidoreductase subunit E [Deltaproteobacteria bacterium]|jgi:NADH-quinone oxidoreductase subunit E|nr:NAD(P)H-dependent oxidoreductase subunit E [Deltaproteobacteria bacterium]
MNRESELNECRIRAVLKEYGNDPQQLTAILLDIQELSGRNYVAEPWARQVAAELDVSLTRVYETLTFYGMFSTVPRGKHVIEVCRSTPCRFSGGPDLMAVFSEELGISPGQTTADGLFTLEETNCVGACDGAPVYKIGDVSKAFSGLGDLREVLESLGEKDRG